MRFAQITKGTRARRTIALEMPEGGSARVDVRPLNGLEEADVLAKARAFAESKGVKAPRDGEPLYELGRQVFTLLLACLDPDSAAPVPFFLSPEEVLELDRDRRSYLYECQESWEDQCAPRPSVARDTDFVSWCMKVVTADEGDDGPFVTLRPVLRWSYMRILASLHVTSLALKSPSGSDDESGSATPTSPANS